MNLINIAARSKCFADPLYTVKRTVWPRHKSCWQRGKFHFLFRLFILIAFYFTYRRFHQILLNRPSTPPPRRIRREKSVRRQRREKKGTKRKKKHTEQTSSSVGTRVTFVCNFNWDTGVIKQFFHAQ